jgi:small redox-active disulfide protein 2
MKLIQVLGIGCQKCEKLAKNVETAVAELGVEARVERVTDISTIISFDVLMTPALAIDGEVKVVGEVPTPEDIKNLLAQSRDR